MNVWTFVLSGSGEFSIFVPNNPALHYQGTTTVWKFFGTEGQMSELKKYIEENFGVGVEINTVPGPPKSPEIRYFPTVKCPSCSFFDIHTPTMCGLADWEISRIDAVFKYRERAESDFEECPLKKNRHP